MKDPLVEQLLAEVAAGRATCCRGPVERDPQEIAQDAMQMGSQDPDDWPAADSVGPTN